MIEKFKIKLETVSPVFIGTDKTPFISGLAKDGGSGEWAYYVDLDKFRKEAFANLGLTKTFELARQISALYSSAREEQRTLSQILADRKLEIKGEAGNPIMAKYHVGTRGGFVKNGVGKAYLPASSVKGALRTAVFFWFSSSMLDVVERELVSLKEDVLRTRDEREREFILRRASKKLVNKSFQGFTYRDIFSSPSRAYPDNRDFLDLFRIVVVTDSDGLQPKSSKGVATEESRLFGKLVEYRRGSGGYIRGRDGRTYRFFIADFEAKGRDVSLKDEVSFVVEDAPAEKIARKVRVETPEKAEFYSPNPLVKRAVKVVSLEQNEPIIKGDLGNFELFWGVAEMEIGIDRIKFDAMGYEPPFSDAKGLVELAKKFYQRVWEHEKSFAQKFYARHAQLKRIAEFYEQEPADMRIGWGSGLIATTVLSLATDTWRRGLLDVITPHRRPNQLAPKSKKIAWVPEGPWAPLGWVKLSII